jgi:hypothetical protein
MYFTVYIYVLQVRNAKHGQPHKLNRVDVLLGI